MKKLAIFILSLFMGASLIFATPATTFAADDNNKCENAATILGMRPWFYGLVKSEGSNCVVKSPADLNGGGQGGLQKFIMAIVLNIIYDLSVVAGILTVAMIIYGAYQFVMAGGDVGKTMKAKKTLTNAIVGLIIALLSWAIVGFISNDFLKLTDCPTTDPNCNAMNMPQTDIDVTLRAGLQLATAMVGVVAIVFIIYSGIQYTTSAGDAGKVQKAKNTIVYSVIGLVIAILSFVIVTWVLGNVN